MPLNGSEPYDKEDFFEQYIQKRKSTQSPNDTLEKPIMNELIGTVKGKHILDLGCGDGKYGTNLLERGAIAYHGIDNSSNMVSLALAELKGKSAKIEKISIEDFTFTTDQYDLIISRLALHYIQNLPPLANAALNSLKEGGRLIFSVEHPVITSSYKNYNQGKKRGSWEVDNYFHEGERINVWMGEEVIKYHRTLEQYFQIFQGAGFTFVSLRESKPLKKYFEKDTLYQRRMRIPLFLFMEWKRK